MFWKRRQVHRVVLFYAVLNLLRCAASEKFPVVQFSKTVAAISEPKCVQSSGLTNCLRLRAGSSSPWATSQSTPPLRNRNTAKTTPRRTSPSSYYPSTQQYIPPIHQIYTSFDDQHNEDNISAKYAINSFLTRDSRNGFIARVYAILSAQLLVTALSITMFGLNPSLSALMHRPGLGAAVPIISLIVSTVAWVFMSLNPSARRRAPLKWQLLVLFTLGEAVSVGFLSSFYNFTSVVMAMIATATGVLAVSLYTAYQKNPAYDLSQWGAGLSSIGTMFLVYSFMHMLQLFNVLPVGFVPFRNSIYSLVGAALFSLYLAHHTKLIVAGKHAKYQMNEQDYVYGAMTLYNDIINVFIYILRMLGEEKDRRR